MYTALNISNSSIKVLSLNGRKVKKWGSVELEAGLVRDGLITDPPAVEEAIGALFKSAGIAKENVITGLAGLSFTYRFIDLPVMKPALVEEAVTRAAAREISLPLEDLYLTWQPLPPREQEQPYFLLGVARNIIDALVETLHIAGIRPYLADLRPLALARAANRGDAIVVNTDADCFDIVFIADGLPRVIHSISPRGEGATLEDNIQRLIDALTKTVAFYQSSHPERRPPAETPLLLTGELADDIVASELLQMELEYPVETLAPPVAIPADLPPAPYMVNIGLALKRTPVKSTSKDSSPPFYDININLLDGKYRRKKTPPVPARKIIFSIVLAAAVLALYPLYQAKSQMTVENALLAAELRGIERELNLASLASEEAVLTQQSIDEILTSVNVLRSANRNLLLSRGDFTGNLELVTGVQPPDTYFSSIEIEPVKINIQGESGSVFSVVDYAAFLEATGAFGEVRIARLDDAPPSVTGISENETAVAESGLIAFEIVIDKEITVESGGTAP